MQIGGYDTHPIANAYPLLAGDSLKLFREDVRAHGLRNRVGWLYQGKILDGRNRAVIAAELGLELEWRVYEGDDAEGFADSLNLHRRQMSESARAAFAATRALRPRGRRKKAAGGDLPTLAELADQADVGVTTLKDAKHAIEKGEPELGRALLAGEVTASRAAELAELPRAEQLEQIGANRPAPRAELRDRRRARTQRAAGRKPPDEVLIVAAKRAWERMGATIETLATNEVLVRYDDLTFELRLQRSSSNTGRAA